MLMKVAVVVLLFEGAAIAQNGLALLARHPVNAVRLLLVLTVVHHLAL